MANKKNEDSVGAITGVLVKMPEKLRDEIEYIAEHFNETFTGRVLTLLEKDVENYKTGTGKKVIPQTALRKAKNISKK